MSATSTGCCHSMCGYRRLLVVVVAKDAFPRTLAAGHNDPRQLAQTVLRSGWIQGRIVDSTVIAAYYDTPVDATMSLRVLSSCKGLKSQQEWRQKVSSHYTSLCKYDASGAHVCLSGLGAISFAVALATAVCFAVVLARAVWPPANCWLLCWHCCTSRPQNDVPCN